MRPDKKMHKKEFLLKQLVKHIVAGAMLGSALVSTSVMAEQKLAVVDVQGVFQAMPQAAEIQNAIQVEFKDQIEEVNQLQRDGQFYAERLQRDQHHQSFFHITGSLVIPSWKYFLLIRNANVN